MGDIIEFVTSPSLTRMSFKIPSSGINFDVKTHGYATLGLSRNPGTKYEAFITIGINHMTWIGESIGDGAHANTPNILSANQFTRFWLLWTGDVISIGKNGHVDPIITHPSKTPDCMYVSFLSDDHHQIHWKVELPPTFKKPPMKHITKGQLRWEHVDQQLPDDALIAGFEKENLYIIRAPHRGSLTPGKFVPSEGTGYVSWGGEAHEKEDLEVLCGYNCKWVSTKSDRIPVGAVGAGHSEVRREVLYVGRLVRDGHNIPGKVQPSHKVCYIPYNDKEVAGDHYEILTVPCEWPCVNKYIMPNEDGRYNVANPFDDQMHDLDEEDMGADYWEN